MRHKTISEIIASRLRDIRSRHSELSDENPTESNEIGYIGSKLNFILEKCQLDNQDKAFLLEYLQSKQRFTFNPQFPLSNLKWIIVQEKTLIDKNYDCSRKSFYLFKGKLIFYLASNPQDRRDIFSLDYKGENKPLLLLEKEKGVGVIFQKKILPKCLVFAEKAILLCLQHNPNQLRLIETNCLMTSKEKQEVIKRFSLFQGIEDFKKNFLPHFMAKKFIKSDTIYQMSQKSLQFYLILEGEVQFFCSSQKSVSMLKQENSPLKQLRAKHSHKKSTLITQKLGKGSYFGQQDILNYTDRSQTAKCFSSQCILISITAEIFQRLLSIPDFAKKIKAKCLEKQRERQSKMQNLTLIKKASSTQPIDLVQQKYNLFKTKVFNRLQESEKIHPRKLSLRRSKQKIMHGHTIKLPRDKCKTEQRDFFSMLRVNQSMYLKTLKRFRHSLKQIEEQKKPKKKVQIEQGRSLEKVWHLLGLKQIFSDSSDEDQERALANQRNGRSYYENHVRLKKNIHNNGGLRPKGLTTNCRLKRQYLQYLQNCS